jgi:cation diffusion facilitator family transporter
MAVEPLKKGENAAGISAAISLLLVASKGIVGFISGSSALIGDALHSSADLIVMLASWFGLRIAQRKPTEKFPYGYYKAESLVTLFISGFIVYAAYRIMLEGYSRLFVISETGIPLIAMLVALVSVVLSLFVSKYLGGIGKKINAQSLVVSSKERMMDALSSVVVFAAILMNYYRIPYVEGIVTMLIAVLIFKVGIFSIKDAVFALMDVSPSKEIEKKIKRIIGKVKGVDAFEDLKLRQSGPFIFGEVKVKLKKFISVGRAHEVADEIENKVKQVKLVDSFTVHVEPYKGKRHKLAIPVSESKGLSSEIIEHFGRADYFLFVNVEKKDVSRIYPKKNPFKKRKVRAGLAAAKFIIKESADVLVTKEIGEISLHTLRDNLVDVYKTEGRTAKDVVNRFLKNRLSRLKKATRKKE